jgi:hypothetical protein
MARAKHPDHVALKKELQDHVDRAEFKSMTFEKYREKLEEQNRAGYEVGLVNGRNKLIKDMQAEIGVMVNAPSKSELEEFVESWIVQWRCQHCDAGAEHTLLNDEQQQALVEYGIRPPFGSLTLCEECSKEYNEARQLDDDEVKIP